MKGMSLIAKFGLLIAAVGAANWLIVGIWRYNFVADMFGSGTQAATTGARVVYIVFGAGAVVSLPLLVAAFGRMRAASRSSLEPPLRSPADRDTSQLADDQEFKEFQAWRAARRAQATSADVGSKEQRAA
jgi:uncharacterized membrane protein YuzA (DUF378 family)